MMRAGFGLLALVQKSMAYGQSGITAKAAWIRADMCATTLRNGIAAILVVHTLTVPTRRHIALARAACT